MSQAGYSRLPFTVSSAAYWVGGSPAEAVLGDGILSFHNVYTSAKRALLSYANHLRGFLYASGSNIKVSTANRRTSRHLELGFDSWFTTASPDAIVRISSLVFNR